MRSIIHIVISKRYKTFSRRRRSDFSALCKRLSVLHNLNSIIADISGLIFSSSQLYCLYHVSWNTMLEISWRSFFLHRTINFCLHLDVAFACFFIGQPWKLSGNDVGVLLRNIGLAHVIVCHRVAVAECRTSDELRTEGTTFCHLLVHIYATTREFVVVVFVKLINLCVKKIICIVYINFKKIIRS